MKIPLKITYAAMLLAGLAPFTAQAEIAPVIADASYKGTVSGSAVAVQVSATVKGLLKFSLSHLPAGVLASDIKKATLFLFVQTTPTSGRLTASPITDNSWEEATVTTRFQLKLGAPSAPSDMIALKDNFFAMDVTSVVQDWVDSGVQHDYGMAIQPATITPTTAITFDSKEATGTGHSAFLEIILKGATGATGAVGIIGPTGAIGPAGETGATGPAGATGAQGVTGLQGIQGPTGAQGGTGAQGAQGPTGSQGVVGSTGAQGLVGPTGAKGTTGAPGIVGATGSQGLQGLKGDTGPQGSVGAQGVIGPTGPQGIVGNTGAVGATGATGATGGSGLVATYGLRGGLPVNFTAITNNYTIQGPIVNVTITSSSQRLTGTAAAIMGQLSPQSPVGEFDFGLCYLNTDVIAYPSQIPINFYGGNYTSTVVFPGGRYPYTAIGTVTGLAPSVYTVGFCVRGFGSNVNFDYNDFVNGWVQVTN